MKRDLYNLMNVAKKTLLGVITFMLMPSMYAQSLSEGLVLHYSFQETDGGAVPDQIGNNDGLLVNGAVLGEEDGRHFLDLPDAGDDLARPYLNMGPGVGSIVEDLNDFTISFFLHVPDGYRSDFVWNFSTSEDIANDASGHLFYECINQKTAITPTHHDDEIGNKIDQGTSVATDVWNHITFTLEGYFGSYYVNGVLVDTATFATLPSDIGNTQHNWIGRCAYDGGGETAGQYNVNPAKIADFRFYNRAITEDEITSLADGEGETQEPTAVRSNHIAGAGDFYPNPFNQTTTIDYELASSKFVSLEIYGIDGKLVETLVNEQQAAGTHTIKWNAEQRPNGVYLYKLQADNDLQVGKLIKTGK